MNKFQFLEKLRARLSGLSKEDLSLSEEYYGEMIDDRIEEGMSEEDAVAALGSLDAIVKQILRETPLRRIVKEKVKTRRHLRVWEIAVISAGSPLWVPIALALIIVVLAVYIVTWAAVISLYAADVALAAAGIGSLAVSVLQFTNAGAPAGIMYLGAMFLLFSIAIFGFFGCGACVKGIVFVSKKILLGIKSCFVGKGEKA